MIKRYFSFLMLIVILLLSSCQGQTEEKEFTFIDDANNKVSVDYKPKRVAIIYPSLTGIWQNAGGNVSIGVEDTINRGFVKENEIEIVGKTTGKEINIELLVSYKPDFVISSTDFSNHLTSVAPQLRACNIPTALFRIDDFNDYLRVLDVFSKINQNEEAYNEYGLIVKENVDKVINKAKSYTEESNILLLRASTTKLAVKYQDNFVGRMLDELGSKNICSKYPSLLEDLSMEEVILAKPNKIFVETMGDETKAVSYFQNEIKNDTWQSLDAIKENEYYILEKDLFHYKPNERWAEAYEYLAKILYGESF